MLRPYFDTIFVPPANSGHPCSHHNAISATCLKVLIHQPERTAAGSQVVTRSMRGILFGCPAKTLLAPSFISR